MIYLDTSALLKLVWWEEGSDELTSQVGNRTDLVSSSLLTVEARRSALRNDRRTLPKVDLLLDQFTLIDISGAIIESASRLPDPMLRSLDAIHLATAILLQEDLDVLLTYDTCMLAAATSYGLTAAAPGAGKG